MPIQGAVNMCPLEGPVQGLPQGMSDVHQAQSVLQKIAAISNAATQVRSRLQPWCRPHLPGGTPSSHPSSNQAGLPHSIKDETKRALPETRAIAAAAPPAAIVTPGP